MERASVDCIDPAEPTPGGVPPITSATRTVVAANRAVERGREIDEPDELGAVAVRIVATMLLGERTRRRPRRLALVLGLAQQEPELCDRRREAKVR